MPSINPRDYISKFTGAPPVQEAQYEDEQVQQQAYVNLQKQPQPVNFDGDTVFTGNNGYDSQMAAQAQADAEAASQYNGYENDGLNYSKNLFKDDTIESVLDFLTRMKLTKNVVNKFAELYVISASQDNVLTWSNAWLLQRRANMFKVQVLEFKNTLLGCDADSLLFGDFDLVIEIMAARLESRNGRSFEGFERKAGISNYQYSQTNDVQQSPDVSQRQNRSGLNKLGKFNPFRSN